MTLKITSRIYENFKPLFLIRYNTQKLTIFSSNMKLFQVKILVLLDENYEKYKNVNA